MNNLTNNLIEKTFVIGLTSIFVIGFIRLIIGLLTTECINLNFGIYG